MNIPILMYHQLQEQKASISELSVTTKSFLRQMQWLKKKGYDSISVEQLSKALNHQFSLPPKPVIITFDDGYQNVWDLAKPVLDRVGFTATVFLVPQAIGQYNIWDENKSIPIWPCLDKLRCRQLLESGWELGAHGWSHQSLPGLEPEALKQEIAGAKQALEQQFDRPISVFCYPFGAWDQKVKECVIKSGYTTACAISPGTKSVTEDPWALRRIYIKSSDHLSDFKRKVSNWYLRYRGWRKR